MSKASQYLCNACGHSFSKWSGQCPECHAWNTLEEVRAIQASGKIRSISAKPSSTVIPLSTVDTVEDPRLLTRMDELDRVLGGGIVRGSVVLLGGSPGIGKSTLLIQMLAELKDHKTLYISGEESAQQISLRADRLNLDKDNIRLLSSVSLEEVLATLQTTQPGLVVVDSIQTLASEQLNSAAGSVSQVRECAGQLVQYAKNTNTTLFVDMFDPAGRLRVEKIQAAGLRGDDVLGFVTSHTTLPPGVANPVTLGQSEPLDVTRLSLI